MPQANILSSHKLFSRTAHTNPSTGYLAYFEQAISFLIELWNSYQPDDLLAGERKQDLEWLKLKLRDYWQNIHNSSKSHEFWQGFMEGKYNRRTLSDETSKSVMQISSEPCTSTKTQQIYELGFQVGWRYARLKDYLQRIKKQRKLEEAQRYQDYQQISNLIRQTDDTDSVLSFGWARKRKSGK